VSLHVGVAGPWIVRQPTLSSQAVDRKGAALGRREHLVRVEMGARLIRFQTKVTRGCIAGAPYFADPVSTAKLGKIWLSPAECV
jgi:hypothetical protein